MKPILEIQNLGKKYRIKHLAGGYLSLRERLVNSLKFEKSPMEDFWALNDVSFEVQPGESIGIIGKNGAGKSTLLKILSKITRPTTGRIVSRGRIASLLEVGTGFHPELTGRENIFFNGSLLGMRRKEIENKFDDIVDFSGVEKFLDTPLKHFSSGMQLRLAFAIAAFLEPEILIIDEVLAVGDAEFQKKCMGKMADVSKSGRTILFVSHNMVAVENLCDRAIYLHNGLVAQDGNIQNVLFNYLNSERQSMKIDNKIIELENGLRIKEFFLSSNVILAFDGFDFSILLESASINKITDFSLLFYNHLSERVAIIDLRSTDLILKSNANLQVRISGTISNLSLVEGVYNLGIYISSFLCKGNFLNLRQIEMKASIKTDFVRYAIRDRGYIEVNNSFSVT
jgi:lipopolysaccharide transport system ATP-binding protein